MKKLIIVFFLLYTCSLLLPACKVSADVTTTHNIDVTATILPQASDFQFSLARQDNATTITNGKYYAYTITYGAKQSTNFPTTNATIIFDWSKAVAPNGQNLFDYVYGSASDGYNNAKPVVDITNKTITWTIPNLPAGTTDQKLVFQLFANSYDKSTNALPLYLTASMTNQYVTMPDQTLTNYYQYQAPPPGPTATPGPAPTATPTPPPPPPPLYTVGIPSISQNGAAITITTAYPSKLSISYGTRPINLSHTISSSDYTYRNSLTFPDLAPDTKYYFKFTITSLWGYSTTSETYTFRTAKASSMPLVDNNIIVFTSNGTVYFSETQKQNASSKPSVILTDNSAYQISYALTKSMPIKSIEAVLINKILAAKTLAAIQLPDIVVIPLQEEKPSLFVANINALTTGLYEVYIRITDTNGNIIQKKITDLKVMPRFTVYAKDTGQPLQDARVFLSYYDTQTHHFLPLSQQQLNNIPNPGYTNSQGQLAITLPAGKYRVEESALLYNKVTTDFTIGPGIDQNYPVVYLSRDPLNFASLMTFSGNYLSDSWSKFVTTLQSYAASIRLFHLIAVAVLASFIIVNFLLFTMRSQIKAHHLPVFFLFHMDRMFNQHYQKYLYGAITDENNKPVSQALIEIEDRDTKKIITEITTSKVGRFYLRNTFAGQINLLLSKPGYEITTIPVNTLSLPERGLHLILKHATVHHHSPVAQVKEGISESIGVLFETSLVLTVIMELLFFSIYGFMKTTPYLVISLINILLWLFYLHEHEQKSSL